MGYIPGGYGTSTKAKYEAYIKDFKTRSSWEYREGRWYPSTTASSALKKAHSSGGLAPYHSSGERTVPFDIPAPDPLPQPIPGREQQEAKRMARGRVRRGGGKSSNILGGRMMSKTNNLLNTKLG